MPHFTQRSGLISSIIYAPTGSGRMVTVSSPDRMRRRRRAD
ncbi:hypothetical protein [Nonomuraea jiangxiensis]|nr:hypothetical protein [Nonomuraea jiangxiensis]